MSDSSSSSDEDTGEFNIFQKMRQIRLTSASNSPVKGAKPSGSTQSPGRSPRRKTRRLNSDNALSSNLNILQLVGSEAVEIIQPPQNWQPPDVPVPAEDQNAVSANNSDQDVRSDTSDDMDNEVERDSGPETGGSSTHNLSQQNALDLDNALDQNTTDFGLISSDGVDPERLEEVIAQVEASNSQENQEGKPSLGQFIKDNFSWRAEDISDDFQLLDSVPEVQGSFSRIEKVDIDLVSSSVYKIHVKTDEEQKKIAALSNWRIHELDQPSMPISLESLWNSSILRAKVLRLKYKFNMLREMRMRLLQSLNDVKHEQSQREANERIYGQLREQLREATRVADNYKSTAEEMNQASSDVSTAAVKVEDQTKRLADLERIHKESLSKISKSIDDRIEQVRNAESSVSDVVLAKQKLQETAQSLGVRAEYKNGLGIVSLPFFKIALDLNSESSQKSYYWSFPPIRQEVLEHYQHLIKSSILSVRKVISLWLRALTIQELLIDMCKWGLITTTEVNFEKQITAFSCFQPPWKTAIQLHGAEIFIEDYEDLQSSEAPPELKDALVKLKELGVKE